VLASPLLFPLLPVVYVTGPLLLRPGVRTGRPFVVDAARLFFLFPRAKTEKLWDLKMTLAAAATRVTRRATRARGEQLRLTAENAECA